MTDHSIAGPGGPVPSEPNNDTTSAPQPIDGATALRLLREVVAERPDYVYNGGDPHRGCAYERDGQPSCVVGQALYRAGWSVVDLARLDSFGDSTADRLSEPNFGGGLVSEHATRILRTAQVIQDDCRQPWSAALVAAEEQAAALGVTA